MSFNRIDPLNKREREESPEDIENTDNKQNKTSQATSSTFEALSDSVHVESPSNNHSVSWQKHERDESAEEEPGSESKRRRTDQVASTIIPQQSTSSQFPSFMNLPPPTHRELDAASTEVATNTTNGNTSLAMELWEAASNSQWDKVRAILENTPHVNFDAAPQTTPCKGMTAFWFAAAWDQWDLVRLMLENNPHANIDAAPQEGSLEGITALWLAARRRQWDIVKIMLENNPHANIDATPQRGRHKGVTVLCLAARQRQWDLVKTMLGNNPDANIDAAALEGPKKGVSALWAAARWQQWDLVTMMLENNPHANIDATPEEGPSRGMTPLWFAAFWQEWDLVKLMLENNPHANIDATPQEGPFEGDTLVELAASKRQWELVYELIKDRKIGDSDSLSQVLEFIPYDDIWELIELIIESKNNILLDEISLDLDGAHYYPLTLCILEEKWDIALAHLEKCPQQTLNIGRGNLPHKCLIKRALTKAESLKRNQVAASLYVLGVPLHEEYLSHEEKLRLKQLDTSWQIYLNAAVEVCRPLYYSTRDKGLFTIPFDRIDQACDQLLEQDNWLKLVPKSIIRKRLSDQFFTIAENPIRRISLFSTLLFIRNQKDSKNLQFSSAATSDIEDLIREELEEYPGAFFASKENDLIQAFGNLEVMNAQTLSTALKFVSMFIQGNPTQGTPAASSSSSDAPLTNYAGPNPEPTKELLGVPAVKQTDKNEALTEFAAYIKENVKIGFEENRDLILSKLDDHVIERLRIPYFEEQVDILSYALCRGKWALALEILRRYPEVSMKISRSKLPHENLITRALEPNEELDHADPLRSQVVATLFIMGTRVWTEYLSSEEKKRFQEMEKAWITDVNAAFRACIVLDGDAAAEEQLNMPPEVISMICNNIVEQDEWLKTLSKPILDAAIEQRFHVFICNKQAKPLSLTADLAVRHFRRRVGYPQALQLSPQASATKRRMVMEELKHHPSALSSESARSSLINRIANLQDLTPRTVANAIKDNTGASNKGC